jgi:hypothetical protein
MGRLQTLSATQFSTAPGITSTKGAKKIKRNERQNLTGLQREGVDIMESIRDM